MRLVAGPMLLVVGVVTAASAVAQFSVQTNATASIGGGSGNANYNGTTATSSSFPGPGAITITNAPNTPNLTQATSQVVFNYPEPGGTVTGTAYASVNLASGTLGALGNGNVVGGTVSNEGVTTTMKDTLMFNIPGATSSTVTNIAVSYQVTGSAAATGVAYAFGRNSGMTFGNATITEAYSATDNIIENSGWVSMSTPSLTENLVTFNGVYALTGPSPTVPIRLFLNIQCQSGDCDYSHTGAFTMTLPAGVTYTSASGVFLTQPPPVCNYTLSSGGMAFSATGGSSTIGVAVDPSCTWSITGAPSWISFPGATGGVGNQGVPYVVAANTGGDRTATLTVGGVPFVVEQEALSLAGLALVGSMPHLAAEDGWLTTFTLVNKGTTSATARMSMYGDGGNSVILPMNLPQQTSLASPILASSLDQTIAPEATFEMQTAGPAGNPLVEGAAQMSATSPSVDGFAIFHYSPTNQEAVVPLETRNAPSYVLAFDNTNGVLTGIAIENVSSAAATVPLIVRNDLGVQLLTPPPTITIPPFGHFSCVLSQGPLCYPQFAGIRGTVEIDTPPGARISAMGIRYTPPGTLTTIPALANVTNVGGTMAHLAVNNGWQTTFVLVNNGNTAANATLSFFDDNGIPLSLPLTFPQGAAPVTQPMLTQSIPPNASLWVQSVGSSPGATLPQTGSAQLTTTGNVGGFVIFRYNTNGQEAVVPLESRDASSYLIAFDNTQNTATGIAVSNASPVPISIPVTVRDDTGAVVATGSIPSSLNLTPAEMSLPANGHTSFVLTQPFPQTANIRGTIEFDAPTSTTISVLGIRSPPVLTFTTLPALAK